ncbi:MAG: ORF6N domain-containing protein [archaeon]|nr:ORF6N domain-containing protein [archaeon]
MPKERIESKILFIRNHKVMLDRELAELYDIKTIALRQQVKRNAKRFPKDFMFKLNEKEAEVLVSQNVIPSRRSLGGYLPYVFTEQGVAMLSSVLKSDRAIEVNIEIMRAFTRMRKMIASHKDLLDKVEEIESKYDYQFKQVFETLKQLIIQEKAPKRKIGFHPDR